MRLYLNAEVYTGSERYSDCAVVAQDILDGVYGDYRLADSWDAAFDWDNDRCDEVIFGFPASKGYTHWHYDGDTYAWTVPAKAAVFFNDTKSGVGHNTKYAASPSYDLNGELYDYELGMPVQNFRKYPGDVRMKFYRNLGNSRREGMFLFGYLRLCPLTLNRGVGAETVFPHKKSGAVLEFILDKGEKHGRIRLRLVGHVAVGSDKGYISESIKKTKIEPCSQCAALCLQVVELDIRKTELFGSETAEILDHKFRPFEHAFWSIGSRHVLNELTADQLITPTRDGWWYDGGKWERLHYHTWTVDDLGEAQTEWNGCYQGIMQCNLVIEDLSRFTPEKFGFTDIEFNNLNIC